MRRKEKRTFMCPGGEVSNAREREMRESRFFGKKMLCARSYKRKKKGRFFPIGST